MPLLEQIAFKTPAPALTVQVNCAYAYAAASHADAWLAEHFQKQNALKGILLGISLRGCHPSLEREANEGLN